MKRLSKIFFTAAVSLMLTGCGLYNKYESKTSAPVDAFGSDISTGEGFSISDMSWREFFTDPLLQNLIEQVLANNTDLNSVRIAVEKSEASLKAAKMAYLPSLYFSPQGTLGKFDEQPWSKTSCRCSYLWMSMYSVLSQIKNVRQKPFSFRHRCMRRLYEQT